MDLVTLTTPRGRPARLYVRPGTSDLSVAGATFAGVAGSGLVDEYNLAELFLTGRFVDVGAHIGAVTVAVLLDNPQATALCVEPVPENLAVLRANLEANGLTLRATVLEAAAGTDTVFYGWQGAENSVAHTNRYIGNLNLPVRAEAVAAEVDQVTLGDLLPCDALKLDCEGGEWALLEDRRIAEVPYVFGEYHGGPGITGVMALLAGSHEVELTNIEQTAGTFRAFATSEAAA